MAFIQYLIFNEELLPFPDSYEITLSDVEADSSGETEAGTTQRDVVRTGVAEISVSFSVSPKWVKRLTAYSKLSKIAVRYLDTETLELKEAEMYISNYKVKLEKDTAMYIYDADGNLVISISDTADNFDLLAQNLEWHNKKIKEVSRLEMLRALPRELIKEIRKSRHKER